MGALTDEERATAIEASPLNSKYLEMVDNVSAYEVITGKAAKTQPQGEVLEGGFTNVSGIPAGETAPRDVILEAGQADAVEVSVELDKPQEVKSKTRTKKAAETEEESGGIGGIADSLLGKSGTRQVVRSTGGSIGREIGKTLGEAVLGKKGRTIGGNIGAALGRNIFGTLSKRK